jgi:hypothetical protein
MAIIDMHFEAFLLMLYQVVFINILHREKVLCTSCVSNGPSKFIFMLIIFMFNLIGYIGIKFSKYNIMLHQFCFGCVWV